MTHYTTRIWEAREEAVRLQGLGVRLPLACPRSSQSSYMIMIILPQPSCMTEPSTKRARGWLGGGGEMDCICRWECRRKFPGQSVNKVGARMQSTGLQWRLEGCMQSVWLVGIGRTSDWSWPADFVRFCCEFYGVMGGFPCVLSGKRCYCMGRSDTGLDWR